MAESDIGQSGPKRHALAGRKQSGKHIEKRVASSKAARDAWSTEKRLAFRTQAKANASRKNMTDERRRAAKFKNVESRSRFCPKLVRIYGLFDPRDGSLRYIGKTVAFLNRRFSTHTTTANCGVETRLYNWWRSLLCSGLKPEIELIENVEVGLDWVEAEQFWIAYFRFIGCELFNVSIGGQSTDGYAFTVEHRAKLRSAHTGRKISAEDREKWSAAAKAVWARNPTSRWKPEQLPEIVVTRAERRAAGLYKKRMPASDETKAKISAAKRGKPLTEAHRAKLSEARKGKQVGRKMSLESRQRMSAAHKGVPLSESHRAALLKARCRRSTQTTT